MSELVQVVITFIVITMEEMVRSRSAGFQSFAPLSFAMILIPNKISMNKVLEANGIIFATINSALGYCDQDLKCNGVMGQNTKAIMCSLALW